MPLFPSISLGRLRPRLGGIAAALALTLVAPLAQAEALLVPGDTDGNGAVNLVLPLGAVLRSGDSLGGSVSELLLAPTTPLVDATVIEDVDGDGVRDIAVLRRESLGQSGRPTLIVIDAVDGSVLRSIALPVQTSYRALDSLGDGRVAAWNVSDRGVVQAALVDTATGASLGSASFGAGLRLLATAAAGSGTDARLALLGGQASRGTGQLVLRGADGSLVASTALPARELPVALALGTLPATGGVAVVLAQDERNDRYALHLYRLDTGARLRGIVGTPGLRAVDVAVSSGAQPVIGVLLQGPTAARLRLFDAASGAAVGQASLPAATQWQAVAPIAEPGITGFALRGVEADGTSRAQVYRVEPATLSAAVNFGAPQGEAPVQTLRLAPSRDSGLYQTLDGSLANGSGDHFFVGSTGLGEFRRGLLRFDLGSALPGGSRVLDLQLDLNVSRSRADQQLIALHRLWADWGEGPSNAPGEEGGGTAAATGDATWLHRFFPDQRWLRAGGDYNGVARRRWLALPGANAVIGSPAMIDDAQVWLDLPARNRGWILIGEEAAGVQAMRFDSRTHPVPAVRPVMTVRYRLPDRQEPIRE